jgi:hypothetical protein
VSRAARAPVPEAFRELAARRKALGRGMAESPSKKPRLKGGQAGQTTTVQLQVPLASTTQAGPPMVFPSEHLTVADFGPGPVH